jgi:cytochrome oxidase Cu insertion factor (SCO1/SenC/PrrC family)
VQTGYWGSFAVIIRPRSLAPQPDHLARYVALFHPRLIGLTADSEAIRKAALAYKVFYAKAAGASPGDYTIDHTAFIYLIGPAGQYLGFLPPGTDPDRLAQVLRESLASAR